MYSTLLPYVLTVALIAGVYRLTTPLNKIHLRIRQVLLAAGLLGVLVLLTQNGFIPLPGTPEQQVQRDLNRIVLAERRYKLLNGVYAKEMEDLESFGLGTVKSLGWTGFNPFPIRHAEGPLGSFYYIGHNGDTQYGSLGAEWVVELVGNEKFHSDNNARTIGPQVWGPVLQGGV